MNAVRTAARPWSEIEVVSVYITPANHKAPNARGERRLYLCIKLDLLSGVYQELTIPATRPQLLCGDFNTPQHLALCYVRKRRKISCEELSPRLVSLRCDPPTRARSGTTGSEMP